MYKLSADNKFSEHQRVRTEGAVDVTHILIRSLNLLVFANNRGDSINSPQKSWVYRWDSTTQRFFKHSELDTYRVRRMSAFIGSDDTGMSFFHISYDHFYDSQKNLRLNLFYFISTNELDASYIQKMFKVKEC